MSVAHSLGTTRPTKVAAQPAGIAAKQGNNQNRWRGDSAIPVSLLGQEFVETELKNRLGGFVGCRYIVRPSSYREEFVLSLIIG